MKRYFVDAYSEDPDGDMMWAADHDRTVAEAANLDSMRLGHIEDLELQICRLKASLDRKNFTIERLKSTLEYFAQPNLERDEMMEWYDEDERKSIFIARQALAETQEKESK